eukprot:Phypoly_transcript_12497.p1 GENE.Phypoly_transcript_12497~~Phypoly_transcript_12497.p1  ORF type:complete len:204 (+),score=21.06 Phypoly_transcript_12497:111-722(+)
MSKKIVYAECPSPSTKEEYETCVESMFANVLSEENNMSWKSFSYSDQGESGFKDIKIYDKETPNCPLDAMKVTGTIPCSVDGLLNLFWDFEKRKAYEKDLIDVTLLEKISDNIEVIRTRYSAPFPVTSRQFVMVRAKIIKEGVAYLIGFSINHSACVEDSGYVLGVSRFNITIIRPTGMLLFLHNFAHISCIRFYVNYILLSF